MATAIPALTASGVVLPLPGSDLKVADIVRSARIAEKTIELTTCAQFGRLFGVDMVWFGLTQAQEREHGFDAATNLGGRAFILQFKASSIVPQSGTYPHQRRFSCQHQQMDRLVNTFGAISNACFYFLPNIGRFAELTAKGGDILGHSYLVDVAGIQAPVPATTRKNGYHYLYLDTEVPSVTITSVPFQAKRVVRASNWAREVSASKFDGLPPSNRLLALARNFNRQNQRLSDLFYKNSALVVLPSLG